MTILLHMRRVVGRLIVIGLCVVGVGSGCKNERQQPEPLRQETLGKQRRAENTTPAVSADQQDQSQPPQPGPFTDTFHGTTDLVEQQRLALDPVVLRDVSSAQQAGFDRVVFEFQDMVVPGYRVAYAESPVRRCGSGETVSVQGGSQLFVRLSPAQAHTETGTLTIRGRERHPNLPNLKELEISCDFEGEVTWVLGLSMRKPYRVLELSEPARLVVDIQH